MTRRVCSVALVLASLVSLSCSPAFDVHVSSQATIQSGGLVSELLPADAFPQFVALDLSQTQDFKNSGIKKSEVKSVELTSLTLKIVSPRGATFSFLHGIAFSVETDGQPTREVAHQDSIPASATSVSLAVDGVELAPYVTAPHMTLSTSATGVPPSQDTTIEADATFRVVPNL